jgi:D-glycero-D-manno-heptose 1,7-bisphosphate phosphatase
VKLVHDYFTFTLEEAGVLIDDIFYSPHHQDFSKSLDRKPGSLMFEKAIAMHGIDPLKSFMIGDSARDIIACEATKVSGFLIEPNSNLNFILNYL